MTPTTGPRERGISTRNSRARREDARSSAGEDAVVDARARGDDGRGGGDAERGFCSTRAIATGDAGGRVSAGEPRAWSIVVSFRARAR